MIDRNLFKLDFFSSGQILDDMKMELNRLVVVHKNLIVSGRGHPWSIK